MPREPPLTKATLPASALLLEVVAEVAAEVEGTVEVMIRFR
jgi:hypothetical protein